MATKFTHGVRTTANRTAWVQTGFTPEQADAEAARLNAEGALPGVEYVADSIKRSADTSRYVTELDGKWYAADYSLARGNELWGPFGTEAEAANA